MVDAYLRFGQQTYLMGILNVTPDSFSGDGLLAQKEVIQSALDQATRFVDAGANILDIGGESTRPGAKMISAEDEIRRILPVIEAIVDLRLNVLISVDTYKAAVAEAALKSGVHWVNDVWGLRADEGMAEVVAMWHAPVVLMHNRSQSGKVILKDRLGGQYLGANYGNLIDDVKRDLLELVTNAQNAGVLPEQIILDPGVGFGKSVEQNLELVNRLDEIKALGYPVLLGPSRKSFIGYTLDLPPEDRLEGTAAVCAIGIARGADILRVHDVEAIARVIKMSDAVVRPHDLST
ncbi:MAG: dihydropteroate synthase [Anaerolineaceae bacterium]